MRTGRWLVPMALAVALAAAPSVALAHISGRIVENDGIKTAKLNLHDSTNRHRLGWKCKHILDTDYQGAGYTVHEYFFGAKSSKTHKYPLEMYSKSNRHVFTFIINSSALVTKNGTHVGTTESDLTSRYGPEVKKFVTSPGTASERTYYRMGDSGGHTEFWLKSGKVDYIVVTKY